MSYYVGIPLLFLAALIEASVMPLFRIAGLQPNLVLVILIAWLAIRGPVEAFILIPIAGLFLGLVDGAPMGTALLALAPIALLHELRGSQLREGEIVVTVILTVVMTVLYHVTYLLVYTVQGASGSWPAAIFSIIVPAAFLNVLVLLPVYGLMWMSSGQTRRASYA